MLFFLQIWFVINLAPLCQQGVSPSHERRIEKVLEQHFHVDDFGYEQLACEEFNSLYKIISDGDFLGYLALSHAKGRTEQFKYMVVYSSEAVIEKVKVIHYTSSHGTEINSKRWLKQFIGKSDENLVYGKDISAISGATYSATSITNDIPLLTRWVKDKLDL